MVDGQNNNIMLAICYRVLGAVGICHDTVATTIMEQYVLNMHVVANVVYTD